MEKTEDTGRQPESKQDKQPAPPLVIMAQYVKDLSFEVPGLPDVLFDTKAPPALSIDIDIQPNHFKDDKIEVSLKLKIHAKDQDKTIFLCELVYGALAAVNVPQEHLEPVLLVEVPRMIFPFARQIVADITKESGFLPVVLSPIDFFSLYQQRQQAKAAEEAKSAPIN